MKKSYCFCGLSTFSYRAAVSLAEEGMEVLVIDKDPELIQRIGDRVSEAVCADVRNRDVLRSLGALDCDTVIVALPNDFDVAILTVHFFREEGMSRIIAEVQSEEAEAAIRVVGATEVVFPERDAADRLVRRLVLPGLVEHFALSREAGIIEVQVPESFIGKSLLDLEIRARYGVHVVGIKKPPAGGRPEKTIIAPLPQTRFEAGDVMIVLGSTENLEEFTEAISKENAREHQGP